MKIIAKKTSLNGHIQVPGSKSHTIRALLLASLAEGTSYIRNPLPSADCLSASRAVPLMGAKIELEKDSVKIGQTWTVQGAGSKIHLPSNIVDVGNSGSLRNLNAVDCLCHNRCFLLSLLVLFCLIRLQRYEDGVYRQRIFCKFGKLYYFCARFTTYHRILFGEL